jgi:transcriptional regulator with XRE-family HTH domain
MDEARPRRLGETIRDRRRDLDITQRDLADRIGIDFTYLSKVENDRSDPPSDETLVKIARELDLDEVELLAHAGKVSSAIRDLAAADREFALFLRRFPDLPEARRQALYRQAKKKG